ncbi:transglutaminase family protein [Rhodoferax mekongensis]|uniref:transglutaminase family protein n=1 Tax=Rhodoferax mekongensis TaxID=3068341 RepID=UPI0028BE3196|nr:transglutaminase family protein [Rhodoferax sp. TBRC 17199]MDT7515084.1 transglutaminase family protein [Rhodoferax sp. TBRC 17199]
MLLQVTHETRYDYQPAVETAQHVAYLEPRAHGSQSVLSHSLLINPQPAQQRSAPDVFGNHRCFFSLQVPHGILQVRACSLVSTREAEKPASNLPWETLRDRLRYQAGTVYEPAAEFVFASAFVPRQLEFAGYARPSFVAGADVLSVARDLMERIHTDFTYETNSTQINTPALQALEQRKGVCQDFAHIMLACWRSMGLPARYVSGYLLTRPPPGQVKLIGSDASHAWVSVYVPDLPEGERWVDFDPTNNRWGWHAPGVDYVTVATGRDFGDVSPLRGVIHGGSRHTLTVGVTVEEIGMEAQVAPVPDHNDAPARMEAAPVATQSQSQSQSG